MPTATFQILLSLAERDRHGYGIIQDVEARTNGDLRLSPGTLYRSIQRMLEQGLVSEAKELDDERRRYYRITDEGRSQARTEAARMALLVKQARAVSL